jgi:hypothetical protein
MTDPLAFARRLVAAGVPVFAAPPGGTVDGYQLPTGWQGIKADPRRLDVWRPGHGLAAVCGHGLDVVDVDPRNGGDEALAGLLAAGILPRAYAIVTTPRGGKHLYVASLRVPKTKRDGIDLQAGAPDGAGRGFVWLPPTARHGGTYEVLDDSLDTYGQDDDSGARLLAWFHEGNNSGRHNNLLLPSARELGAPIPAGEHQATLFSYACSLRARAVPEAEAEVLVDVRARDCVPPWGGPDTPWEAVRHAYRYEEGAPPAEYDRSMVLELVRPEAPAPAPPGERFPRIDWAALWNEPEDEDWILEPLIPARRAVALYSAPKLGKSLLMLEVAAAVARGVPVLGVTPEQGPVLYVDFENDPRGDVRRRLRTMGLGPADLDGLHYLSFPSMAAFDSPQGGAELLARAVEAGACLVVIDTVSRTIAGEENSNDTWVAFYRNTGLKLKEAGIAYVRLDHSGKDDTKGMRGGSAKSGDVDAVWQLTKPGTEDFLLFCEAARMNIPEEQRSIGFRRVVDPYLRHERTVMPSKEDADLIMQCAIGLAMDEAGLALEHDLNGRELNELLTAAGIKGTQKAGFAAMRGRVDAARRARGNFGAPAPDWRPEHVEAARRLLGLGFKIAPQVPQVAPGAVGQGEQERPSAPRSIAGARGTALGAVFDLDGGERDAV